MYSKKKIYTAADVLFFSTFSAELNKKKKSLAGFMIEVHISVSDHGSHKMVTRAALPTPAIHSNSGTDIIFTLLHI